jgi:hypothetical protein
MTGKNEKINIEIHFKRLKVLTPQKKEMEAKAKDLKSFNNFNFKEE